MAGPPLSLIIDTGPDFRLQCLKHGVKHLDTLLITHPHADHLSGLDDIRPFTYHKPVEVFCDQSTMDRIRVNFHYIFEANTQGTSRPNARFSIIDGPFLTSGIPVVPVPIHHGKWEILGFRIGPLAYLTDCNGIPESSYALLEGVDTVVIGALRYKPHPTHFSLSEALEAVKPIGARQVFLTHLGHDLEHEQLCQELPPGVAPAFDGLTLTWD